MQTFTTLDKVRSRQQVRFSETVVKEAHVKTETFDQSTMISIPFFIDKKADLYLVEICYIQGGHSLHHEI